MEKESKSSFPLIPEKRYLTIGEVSKWCDVKPHVLRYWESIFTQLKPVRRGGRRFYRMEDLDTILTIHTLLREKKYTIEGAQKKMSQGKDNDEELPGNSELSSSIRQELESILKIIK